MDTLTETFGEVISSYTRKEAIEDGQLIDVTGTEAAKLFRFPVAITSALHEAISVGQGKKPDTYAARLWDVCYMASLAAKVCNSSDIFYKVIVGRRTLELWGNCGPDDFGHAVMTFGFPSDR